MTSAASQCCEQGRVWSGPIAATAPDNTQLEASLDRIRH